MVSVNPHLKQRFRYRPSMKKFSIPNPTDSQQIVEVIRVARSSPAYLNRQFIILLDSLGVPKEYFIELQDKTLKNLLSLDNIK